MDNQIQKHSDEIDLVELFSRMGKAIKSFFTWLLRLFNGFILLLVRKSLWLFSFSIIGIFFGYLVYKNTPRYYSSEMIARSNAINNSVVINSINLLNNLFENNNYKTLGSYFGITTQNAEKIKSIEAFYGIDVNRDNIVDFVDYEKKYSPKDTTQKRLTDVFYLKISVYDEAVFKDARDGIKQYLNSNPYLVEYDAVRKKQALSLIEEYKNQIKKLDSLQKVQYFEVPSSQKSGSNQMIILNEKEKKLYHAEIISLYNNQLGLERDLLLNPEPITIIQDFTPLAKVDNPLIKFLKVWVISFFILGFIISLLWQYRRKIWTLIKDKS